MRRTGTIALAALGIVALAGASADARRGVTSRHDVALQATGIDDDAGGSAKLQVRSGSDGRFDVKVKRLDRRAAYEILVNGVRVGALATSGGGNGSIRFRSRPRSKKDALLGFDPRGALVVVRNAAGEDVLAAKLGDDSPGSDDDVICCVPDDSGPACEDRTPAECAAEGGMVSTASSCLPNPCADLPPPPGGDVICCVPDDSGPECEDRTPTECAAEGGMVVTATSCSPNPCAPTPPAPDGDVVCCVPDDSGPECEDRTPAECAAEGGQVVAATSCVPNPCASAVTPSALEDSRRTARIRVKCERRAGRSKVSVDGGSLVAGSYKARVISGANTKVAGARRTVGGEVEFDFDSDAGDVAAGATRIAAAFIQGSPPQVRGAILTTSGSIVVQATAVCTRR